MTVTTSSTMRIVARQFPKSVEFRILLFRIASIGPFIRKNL
jgi:hypothetical protein